MEPFFGSSTVGVRPNSPPQMTSVSSSRPRCLRSTSSAPIAWSHSLGQVAVVDLEVVVAVPRLAGAVPDLHEPHAALDQPAGDENLPGLHAGAVHVADVLRLAADVERLGRLGLHAEAELERLDAGLERGVVLPRLQVAGIEPLQQVELLALLRQRDAVVADVLDELLDRRVLRVDVRAFVDAGQEARLPVLRFLDRIADGAHGDERRQVLVLAAQAVAQPGAEAGPNLPGVAAVHQQQRRLVVRHVGVHRADHGDVVDRLGDVCGKGR